MVSENGFVVVAAGAFVARHSIFPDVAGGRPDRDDLDRMAEFAERVRECLAAGLMRLNLSAAMAGNRPPYTGAANSTTSSRSGSGAVSARIPVSDAVCIRVEERSWGDGDNTRGGS